MESILGDQGRRSTKDLTKIVIREAGYLAGRGPLKAGENAL
jgi:hypothetical protein